MGKGEIRLIWLNPCHFIAAGQWEGGGFGLVEHGSQAPSHAIFITWRRLLSRRASWICTRNSEQESAFGHHLRYGHTATGCWEVKQSQANNSPTVQVLGENTGMFGDDSVQTQTKGPTLLTHQNFTFTNSECLIMCVLFPELKAVKLSAYVYFRRPKKCSIFVLSTQIFPGLSPHRWVTPLPLL